MSSNGRNFGMGAATKRAVRAGRLLLTDPRAFATRLDARLRGRPKPRSGPIAVNGVRFNIDLGLDPRMRQMYLGTYQHTVTRLLKRFLREGDTFVDVGANVGYISAFGLGLVGRAGEVHAFEPVPRYFERLRRVQADNPSLRLHVNGTALGAEPGVATIAVTNLPNMGWNTMVPDFMNEQVVAERIKVPVTTLDDYLADKQIRRVRLVKIDVEGYELPVLRGFARTLRALEEPPILVVEIAPGAAAKLGVSRDELPRFMRALDYECLDVTLASRIDASDLQRTTDVVFVPRASRELARLSLAQ
jgi:FkbM family methyltransferase